MYRYAKNLEFEKAAGVRDEIRLLQEQSLVWFITLAKSAVLVAANERKRRYCVTSVISI
jgi:excinuclease UvrABC nuclease subunit